MPARVRSPAAQAAGSAPAGTGHGCGACLSLVSLLYDLAVTGSQVIVATHSPMVAAVPGATILELGEWGIRRSG